MNLLCCINDGYVYQFVNLILSIREYNQDKIKMFILSTGLSEKMQELISKKCKEANIEPNIKIVSFDKDYYVGTQHFSVDMYLRIYAFYYLENIDKLLYLDVDAISLGDIAQTYNTDLGDKLLGVVRDGKYDQPFVCKHMQKLGVEHDMFNSGMILFNLSQIRKVWTLETIEKVIMDNQEKLVYPDQDILNLLCQEKDIYWLGREANYQIKNNEKVDKDAKIIYMHYVGHLKPWNHYHLAKHEKLFWDAFQKTNLNNFYKIARTQRRQKIVSRIKSKVKKLFCKK